MSAAKAAQGICFNRRLSGWNANVAYRRRGARGGFAPLSVSVE